MCLPNVLDKVLEMGLIFPSLLIILETRVEQWFMKLVLVLFTLFVIFVDVINKVILLITKPSERLNQGIEG